MALLTLTAILLTGYSLLIFYYYRNWRSAPRFIPGPTLPDAQLSVIIPARDEENNIGALLDALQLQTYPSVFFEVIVVDDHSTDNTAGIVRQYPGVKLVQLKEDNINSYKKKAIETGITFASGELIVSTDADCIPPPNWLATIASFYKEKKPVFIAAPVVYSNDHSILQVFQALDFLVLQGITGAAVHSGQLSMCNGANLAYEKRIFNEAGGFSGIDSIASGDDMLLMHKIAVKYPDRVQYLKSKEAIVTTKPMTGWISFFNQRIRWASKAGYYADRRITAVLLLVYLLNLSFAGLLVMSFIKGGNYWFCPAIFILAKTLAELPFVLSVAAFFGKRPLAGYFLFFQPLHIIYTILSGLFGQFGKYQWKGRRVK